MLDFVLYATVSRYCPVYGTAIRAEHSAIPDGINVKNAEIFLFAIRLSLNTRESFSERLPFSVVFGYCLWEPAESLDRRRFRPPGGAETYIRVRFFGADSFSGAFLCVF